MCAVQHAPVLLEEALRLLAVRPGGVYVDCTVGLGGHSEEILRRLNGSGRLIAFDRDEDALVQATERLGWSTPTLQLLREDFRRLPRIAHGFGLSEVDGILADLGVSSLQLDTPSRGFSFRHSAPLDMRMDRNLPRTAADLVNQEPQEELERILREYGEEKSWRRLAEEIVRRRRSQPIETTSELADLVVSVKGRRPSERIHPATQTFQALRIAVNDELRGLDDFLHGAIGLLGAKGRLVVISFHSLEDRIVKRTFQLEAGKCVCFRPADLCNCPRLKTVRILTPKPIRAGEPETAENPRARSAKLRAVEKLNGPTSGQRSHSVTSLSTQCNKAEHDDFGLEAVPTEARSRGIGQRALGSVACPSVEVRSKACSGRRDCHDPDFALRTSTSELRSGRSS